MGGAEVAVVGGGEDTAWEGGDVGRAEVGSLRGCVRLRLACFRFCPGCVISHSSEEESGRIKLGSGASGSSAGS